jgi:hypothetical protein
VEPVLAGTGQTMEQVAEARGVTVEQAKEVSAA